MQVLVLRRLVRIVVVAALLVAGLRIVRRAPDRQRPGYGGPACDGDAGTAGKRSRTHLGHHLVGGTEPFPTS
jgi:hypothetical protein